VVRKGFFDRVTGRRDLENKGIPNDFFTDLEYESITSLLNRYFKIDGSHRTKGYIIYNISKYPNSAGEEFKQILNREYENFRTQLKDMGFLAKIQIKMGRAEIYIFRAPPEEKRITKWNVILFILTLITTIWAGSMLWASYTGWESNFGGDWGAFLSIFEVLTVPKLLLYGSLSFALPLLLILGTHESAHYLASVRNKVSATFPYFIPIPPFIGFLGTFGAFIKIKEPIPSKKTLIQIGAAGPIAGFIVAIPVTIIGFFLTQEFPGVMDASAESTMVLGEPLLFMFISNFINTGSFDLLHPTAFAGWVGLLITAFNLLPAGQLDGGHIWRGLLGEKAKYLSFITVGALLVMGYFFFSGWLLFSLLIILLGIKHPPPLNDITPLRSKEKIIGVVSVAILVLCFIPAPLEIMDEKQTLPDIHIHYNDPIRSLSPNGSVSIQLYLNNTGEGEGDYSLTFSLSYHDFRELRPDLLDKWNITVDYKIREDQKGKSYLIPMNGLVGNELERIQVSMPGDTVGRVNITFKCAGDTPLGSQLKINFSAIESGKNRIVDHVLVGAQVSYIEMSTETDERLMRVVGNEPSIDSVEITVTNKGITNDTYVFNTSVIDMRTMGPYRGLDIWFRESSSAYLESRNQTVMVMRIQSPADTINSTTVLVIINARSLTYPEMFSSIHLEMKIEFILESKLAEDG